ncbi:hypothetical protein NDU88_002725 [Pleurodeles waltl]|uniref:Uncharacterized protein n=1 Tax=Pleurodeles waltl TaxID=8319 RepID=A0AAV7V0I2_PLEWA|nr:hypothetical protein NDU88_002725 [Pleurodeles waltl]
MPPSESSATQLRNPQRPTCPEGSRPTQGSLRRCRSALAILAVLICVGEGSLTVSFQAFATFPGSSRQKGVTPFFRTPPPVSRDVISRCPPARSGVRARCSVLLQCTAQELVRPHPHSAYSPSPAGLFSPQGFSHISGRGATAQRERHASPDA